MKKSLILTSILLTISVLWFGCKKDNTPVAVAEISGKVLELGSNKPIPNAQILISECETSPLGSNTCYASDTIFSDAQGNYKFAPTKEINSKLTWFLTATKPSYNKAFVTLSKNIFTTRNIVIEPIATIRVRAINTKPFDDNDKLDFATSKSTLWGKKVDTTLMFSIEGNVKKAFFWYVTKNGVFKRNIDTLYIKSTDTIDYRILY
jgi:hypothetical protein